MTKKLDIKYSFYAILHPYKGFEDLKREKRGDMRIAIGIIFLTIMSLIFKKQLTAFTFNPNNTAKLNIWIEFCTVLIPLCLWVVANWCLTTLMDGEGNMRDIFIASSYALLPIPIIYIPNIILSYALILEEKGIYTFFEIFPLVWAGILIIIGTMATHQYTLKKTLLTTVCIIVGMALIIFIALLFFSVIQQVYGFIYVIYKEMTFRL